MNRFLYLAGAALIAAGGFLPRISVGQTVVWSEDFNSVTLGDSVNERLGQTRVTVDEATPDTTPRPNSFTHSPPTDWSIDNTTLGTYNPGVPAPGTRVEEWEGWTFVSPEFWLFADTQDRQSFSKGTGVMMVIDPDEWDDLGPRMGFMSSGITTARIDVTGRAANSLVFSFDQSWKNECCDDSHGSNAAFDNLNNPTGLIFANYYDAGGALMQQDLVHARSSNPADVGLFFPDNFDESVSFNLTNPAGAASVEFNIQYLDTANDWWWALDNLALAEGGNPAFYTENFDGLALGDSINERLAFAAVTQVETDPNSVPVANAYSQAGPAGWSMDNSTFGGPATGIGDPDNGVQEWEGWSFVDPAFWATRQTSGGADFTKGTGAIAVADSDEWNDLGSVSGDYNTFLVSPSIDVSSIVDGTLTLSFDSSWRPEGHQTAEIFVSYDGGAEERVLWWESDEASPNFHGDNTNESVEEIMLNNPAGASSAVLRFVYTQAHNNWWWAIDNIEVKGQLIPEPSTYALLGLALAGLAVGGLRRRK